VASDTVTVTVTLAREDAKHLTRGACDAPCTVCARAALALHAALDAPDPVAAAVAAERERCARVCEEMAGGHYMARVCAAAIRALPAAAPPRPEAASEPEAPRVGRCCGMAAVTLGKQHSIDCDFACPEPVPEAPRPPELKQQTAVCVYCGTVRPPRVGRWREPGLWWDCDCHTNGASDADCGMCGTVRPPRVP